jgi:ferrous iron transport protein A
MLFTKDLKPGDKVILNDYGLMPREYRRYLMSMGLMRGVTIEIMPATPMGCPWLIKVGGGLLSLWPKMLETVTWERFVCAS